MRALVITILALVAGCRDEYCSAGGTGGRCNGPNSGTATVTGPAQYGAFKSVRAGAGSCLGLDGTCSVRPPISVTAEFVDFNTALGVLLTLPAREGSATYPVSRSSTDVVFDQAFFDADLNDPDIVLLMPLSGSVVVEHLTADGFRATLDMQMETPDHEVFSISAKVETAGCELFSYPGECHAYD